MRLTVKGAIINILSQQNKKGHLGKGVQCGNSELSVQTRRIEKDY